MSDTNDTTQDAKTVRMIRDEPLHPGGPTNADVHPEEVAAWAQVGWREAEDEPPKSLSDMTVKALRELAKEKGVPIPADATTKDAIVGILEAAGVTLEAQA